MKTYYFYCARHFGIVVHSIQLTLSYLPNPAKSLYYARIKILYCICYKDINLYLYFAYKIGSKFFFIMELGELIWTFFYSVLLRIFAQVFTRLKEYPLLEKECAQD